MLSKFQVRKAQTPRNSPFTFYEDGFYRILKKNIREELPNVPPYIKYKSKLMTDFLCLTYLSTAVLAATHLNYYIGIGSGMLLAMLTIAAHNFFHMKDNFRMYYFDMSLMSSR